MRPVDQAISIAQQSRAYARPESLQGIVSPCSVCVNQRIAQTPDGRPGCPRRSAASLKLQMDDQGADSSSLDLVVLTGVNGQSDDGTQPLANPVYDTATNTILVWTAAINDNPPLVDQSSGAVVSPGLLDPAFSTDWIVCRPLPFTPQDSEAQYFQKGALMEGDQVEATVATKQQVSVDAAGNSAALSLAGTVRKVNFHTLFPRIPVDQDLAVPGT
jgi:hypothetical protein